MDRTFSLARRTFGWSLLFSLLFATSGCGVLQFAMYVVHGIDVKADYKGLKGKKVAVVCRPGSRFDGKSMAASRSVAVELGRLLRENGSRIDVVRQQEIDNWVDQHGWEKLEDIDKLGADLQVQRIVTVDLDSYNVDVHTTLLQGRADMRVTVFDFETEDGKGLEEGKIAYENELLDAKFPNNPIPSSDAKDDNFDRIFVRELAARVGQLFYNHDPYADFARDSTLIGSN